MTARAEQTAVLDRPASNEPPPRLADGIELVGEFEGSGYKEPHFIARRDDGQVVQLTELLFHVADACDGECGWDEIAERVSERYGKNVTADQIQYLVAEKLRPLGLLIASDGTQPHVAKNDPMLALRFRVGVVSPQATRRIARLFTPLFWPPVVLGVVAAFVAMDVWFFGQHGVGGGMRDMLYEPATILVVFGLVVVSAAFHELGHAAAILYGGANPGRMGAGVYMVWPAFFTDVTDAYRLGRAGRLRTDLGGVYFNMVFSLATVAAYAATGFEPLLVVLGIQHFEMLHQLLPFLRLDGYYVLADATGVPDLFARIKPIFRSLAPWRKTEDSVNELKPWVRVAVTAWVLVIVPLLAYLFATMVISAPRLLATAWDSIGVQRGKIDDAFGDGDVLGAMAGIVQVAALALPVLGIAYSLQRLVRRTVAGAWRWSGGSIVRRSLVSVALVAAVAFAAFTLWPNGEYRPLQPGERLTVADTVRDLRQVKTGRPGLTAAEARAVDGAPALAEATTAPVEAEADAAETGTSTDPLVTTTTSPTDDASGSTLDGDGDGDGSTVTTVTTSDTTSGSVVSTTTTEPTTTTTDATTSTTAATP
ncbi:MAG TPA: hypothetical protein VF230_04900 [Acidimicrobiales bacterium]